MNLPIFDTVLQGGRRIGTFSGNWRNRIVKKNRDDASRRGLRRADGRRSCVCTGGRLAERFDVEDGAGPDSQNHGLLRFSTRERRVLVFFRPFRRDGGRMGHRDGQAQRAQRRDRQVPRRQPALVHRVCRQAGRDARHRHLPLAAQRGLRGRAQRRHPVRNAQSDRGRGLCRRQIYRPRFRCAGGRAADRRVPLSARGRRGGPGRRFSGGDPPLLDYIPRGLRCGKQARNDGAFRYGARQADRHGAGILRARQGGGLQARGLQQLQLALRGQISRRGPHPRGRVRHLDGLVQQCDAGRHRPLLPVRHVAVCLGRPCGRHRRPCGHECELCGLHRHRDPAVRAAQPGADDDTVRHALYPHDGKGRDLSVQAHGGGGCPLYFRLREHEHHPDGFRAEIRRQLLL